MYMQRESSQVDETLLELAHLEPRFLFQFTHYSIVESSIDLSVSVSDDPIVRCVIYVLNLLVFSEC